MKKRRFQWMLLLVATAVMGATAIFQSRTGELHDLEFKCTDFHTFVDQAPGWTADFNRVSRARCSEEFFEAFRTKYGFTIKRIPNQPSQGPDWSSSREGWWNPPQNDTSTYLKRARDERTLLAFKDGFIYYDISVW
ncbi:MAG: hypothetical protein V4819_16010 [Verrucomicrobiota bacterium]